MTMKTALTGASAAWALARTSKFMPQIAFEAEGTGSGDTAGADDAAAKAAAAAAAETAAAEKAAADKAAADAAAADAGDKKSGMTENEAKLLKESMARKEALKEAEAKLAALNAEIEKFKDIDPAKARDLLAKEKEAEKQQLEAKGEFERLKKMMAEEHAKEKDALAKAKADADTSLAAALARINELTVGQAFSNSDFVRNELVMPAAKVRQVYDEHFEVEGERIVAYDKPKGKDGRTKLVDGSGEPMSFEAAMAKIIDLDPDRDNLKKAKMKQGAGSTTNNDVRDKGDQSSGQTGLKGMSRMIAALEDRKK
jgi:hypothetical protein